MTQPLWLTTGHYTLLSKTHENPCPHRLFIADTHQPQIFHLTQSPHPTCQETLVRLSPPHAPQETFPAHTHQLGHHTIWPRPSPRESLRFQSTNPITRPRTLVHGTGLTPSLLGGTGLKPYHLSRPITHKAATRAPPTATTAPGASALRPLSALTAPVRCQAAMLSPGVTSFWSTAHETRK